MGDPGNFNTVLQFFVKSIIEKIPKIQKHSHPNLTTAEVKTMNTKTSFEILVKVVTIKAVK